MERIGWWLAGGLVVMVGIAGWLYVDNRDLRRQLSERPAVEQEAAAVDPDDPWSAPAAKQPRGAASAEAFLRGVNEATSREKPTIDVPDEPTESRAERRKRRQSEIAAFLGRMDGETEQEYLARMIPLIEAGLSEPRDRMAELRREAEEAAGVTNEQREELDAVFGDVYSEVLELTNGAVASGELTPYDRNWSGVLNYAGGLGAVLGGAEDGVGKILSAEQRAIMYESGFEWGEYLGVNAPWEKLNPPPPPPGNDG